MAWTISMPELGEGFQRLTASHASDPARTRLIERLKRCEEEALPELVTRLQRIIQNSKGIERQEAKRLLDGFFGERG